MITDPARAGWAPTLSAAEVAPPPSPDQPEPGGALEPDPATQPEPAVEPELAAGPDPAVIAVADQLVAELAAEEARRQQRERPRLLSMGPLGGPAGPYLIAAAGGITLLVVIVLGLTLLGLLLGH